MNDITNFLNTLISSNVKLVYKTYETYYASFLLVGHHQLKIMSTNPQNCCIEGPSEIEGYLNAFSINTYIKSPDSLTLMWRLQLVINDVTCIVSMDSEPIMN